MTRAQVEKTGPMTMVVFGATGDLMRRKIAGALLHLMNQGLLPKPFSVIGFSRRDLGDEGFRNLVREAIAEHVGRSRLPRDFLDTFYYHQGRFDEPADYGTLSARVAKIDDHWGVCANKLVYLAVPPEHYLNILTNVKETGLCDPTEGWIRLLVEKPFGKNLEEAEKIDRLLADSYREDQVYRIDHYLAKEVLQNMLVFRFSNNLLEEVWNKAFIEKIEIKLLENIGLEGRGAFYDGLGALQDVGQNHLLQMLALATMDGPSGFSGPTIRQKRAAALAKLRVFDESEAARNSVRGQYEGYLDEPGVAPDSRTETYFKVRAYVDSPRWEGVPIYLEAGKRAPRECKEVVVTFKHPVHCLCPPSEQRHYKNKIHFRADPKPGIAIRFWSKKPGEEMVLEEQVLEFHYKNMPPGSGYMEEYVKVLHDCMVGDQTLFISGEEALSGWRFIDPIVSAWNRNLVPLRSYSSTKPLEQVAASLERWEAAPAVLKKEIGIVGLGKMGGNIARHLAAEGWRVVGFNRTRTVTDTLTEEGLVPAYSLKDLVNELKPPRLLWVMVPAGQAVDDMVFGAQGLTAFTEPGDVIIDAGNSHFKDTRRRAEQAESLGVKFIDVGVSGGPKGAHWGACLMVGGDLETYQRLLPLYLDLAVSQGVQFFEGPGAGHFVKMVHNGIEYGMMQAIAEGFGILRASEYGLDLAKAADIYNHGSVIESRLIAWLRNAFTVHGQALEEVSGKVGFTGEGEWTIQAAEELGVPADNIKQSLDFRRRSQEHPNYVGKILTALRDQFGGHGIK